MSDEQRPSPAPLPENLLAGNKDGLGTEKDEKLRLETNDSINALSQKIQEVESDNPGTTILFNEKEMIPENDADMINVGNIFAVIFVVIGLLIGTVLIVRQIKVKKEAEVQTLERIGGKHKADLWKDYSDDTGNYLVDENGFKYQVYEEEYSAERFFIDEAGNVFKEEGGYVVQLSEDETGDFLRSFLEKDLGKSSENESPLIPELLKTSDEARENLHRNLSDFQKDLESQQTAVPQQPADKSVQENAKPTAPAVPAEKKETQKENPVPSEPKKEEPVSAPSPSNPGTSPLRPKEEVIAETLESLGYSQEEISKYVPETEIPVPEPKVATVASQIEDIVAAVKEEVLPASEEIITPLPIVQEIQQPFHAIDPDAKPETRASSSTRVIGGIGGLENRNKEQESVLADLSGLSSGGGLFSSNSSTPVSSAQPLSGGLTGTNTSGYSASSAEQNSSTYRTSKENFYANSSNSAGKGEFLSINSLWDGTIITGALVTGINTDNPGVVMARVTENVYSSYDGRYLLIPEGTILYADYNSDVSYGQTQVQVAWNLLIRPDGYRLQLGNMNGVNAQGESGYGGTVSNHPFATAKALGLVALFSVIQVEVQSSIKSADNDYLKNALSDVYSTGMQFENRILEKALDIKPTIKIQEGTQIKLITNRPLELPPCEIPEATVYQRRK